MSDCFPAPVSGNPAEHSATSLDHHNITPSEGLTNDAPEPPAHAPEPPAQAPARPIAYCLYPAALAHLYEGKEVVFR